MASGNTPKPCRVVSKVRLKVGATAQDEALEFDPGPMTIVVGPNNSGKSLLLREIAKYARRENNSDPAYFKILTSLTSDALAENVALDLVRRYAVRSDDGQLFFLSQQPGVMRGWQPIQVPDKQIQGFLHSFGILFPTSMYLTILLDGKTRLSLTDPAPASDTIASPDSHLMALFQNSQARLHMREIIRDAFGYYLVIDPTNLSQLRIRMSTRAPVDEAEEQALDARARTFHANAINISELSDGVKAFTGLLAALLGGKFLLTLIDEPEAFLHPPLARKLGFHLARLGSERDGNIFVSTHSADLVMGCVESGIPTNIVRLTYESGVATARILKSTRISDLLKDPLLRSVDVLDALFHRGVVIAESDADRVFYQEVNHRLFDNAKGDAKDVLFINAQNKQTIHRILGPLRSMGIPAVGIVDIDYLKEGGPPFVELLKAAQVPSISRESLSVTRAKLWNIFKELKLSGKLDMKRDGGINLLSGAEREGCQGFFEELARYGIFVTPYGELESWLKPLGATGHGPDWLINMFTKMGNDPSQPGYVVPTAGDVWDFMRQVAAWLQDPNRRGLGAGPPADEKHS